MGNQRTTDNATRSRAITAATRKKTAARRKPLSGNASDNRRIDDQTRHAMIAQAAYFRAEHRGFMNDGELNDWLEAEREITRMFEG